MEEIDLAAAGEDHKDGSLALNAKAVVRWRRSTAHGAAHRGGLDRSRREKCGPDSDQSGWPNAVPMYDVYAQIAYS